MTKLEEINWSGLHQSGSFLKLQSQEKRLWQAKESSLLCWHFVESEKQSGKFLERRNRLSINCCWQGEKRYKINIKLMFIHQSGHLFHWNLNLLRSIRSLLTKFTVHLHPFQPFFLKLSLRKQCSCSFFQPKILSRFHHNNIYFSFQLFNISDLFRFISKEDGILEVMCWEHSAHRNPLRAFFSSLVFEKKS